MADQPYTETDVRLVGDALDAYYSAMGMPPSYRPYGAAKVALDALTAARRLLPGRAVRDGELYGTAFIWTDPTGVRRVLKPAEVTVVLHQANTEDERHG